MYKDYVKRCEHQRVRLGEPYLYPEVEQQTLFGSPLRPWVLNFPTKQHWRTRSKLKDIEEGLDYLERHYVRWDIESLAVPPLGCGNGGLDWRAVEPILRGTFERFVIPVTMYVPADTHGYSSCS